MKKEAGGTFCALGWFKPEGTRHSVMKAGLEEHGYRVIDCITDKPGIILKYIDMMRMFLKHRHDCSYILVAFPGHYVMPLARVLGFLFRKPVVFDVFISLYDTMVMDRKLIKKGGFKAKFQRFMDKTSCNMADILLIDTPEHAQYFEREYDIDKEAFVVVPVGAKADVFKPASVKRANDACEVLFYGTFIPLQGIETIVGAAAILSQDDIRFTMIGKGQTYEDIVRFARSAGADVDFVDPVPLDALPRYINRVDICLGIFGTSDKADRVIPHKAYDIIACGKPLITARTTASMRFFEDGKNALLCDAGSSSDLARKITVLKENEGLRQRIAEGGHRLFLEKCNGKAIVAPLAERLERLTSHS